MYQELFILSSLLVMLHLILFTSSWHDRFLRLISIVFYSPARVSNDTRGDKTTPISSVPPAQASWTVHVKVTVVNLTRSEADSSISVDHSLQGAQVDDSARVSVDVRTPASVDVSPVTASAPPSAPFHGVSYGKPRSPPSRSSAFPLAILPLETHCTDLNSADHIAQVSFDMEHDVDIIGAWLAQKCGAFAGRVYPPVPFSSDPFDQFATEGQRVFMRLDLLVQPETTDLGVHYVVLVVEIVPSHESPTVFTIVERGDSGSEVRRVGVQFHGVFATVDDVVLMDWQSGCAPLGSFLSDDYQRLGRNVRWEKEAEVFLKRHDMLDQKRAHDELCAVWQDRLGGHMQAGEAYYDFPAQEELGGRCQDDGDLWEDDSMVNAPPESVRSSSSLNENGNALELEVDCFSSSHRVDGNVANSLELDFDCFGSSYSLDEVASDCSSPPSTPRSDAGYPFSTTSAWPQSTPTPHTPEFRGFRCPTSSSTFSTTPSALSITPLADEPIDDPFAFEPSPFCMPRTAAA